MLGHLLQKLSIYPELNLVVLADHGQINAEKNHVYFISDYVDKKMLAQQPLCGSVCTIQPAEGFTSEQIIGLLSPLLETDGFRLYKYVELYH